MTRIEVDRDDMERIAHRHGLQIELTADRAYLVCDGIEFTAALPVAADRVAGVEAVAS